MLRKVSVLNDGGAFAFSLCSEKRINNSTEHIHYDII